MGNDALVQHTDLGAYMDRSWDDIAKAINVAIDWYSHTPYWHTDNCQTDDYQCQNFEVARISIDHTEALPPDEGARREDTWEEPFWPPTALVTADVARATD